MEAADFFVEDLLDLPNGDEIMNDAFLDATCAGHLAAGNSTDSSTVTAVDSCNSSVSGADAANFSPAADYPCRTFADAQLSGELCVPYDDMAELEWLSNFVEESFSSEDLHLQAHHQFQRLHLNGAPVTSSGGLPHHHYPQVQVQPPPPPPHLLRPDTSVPGKARSKISRVAPSDWSTRLLMVSSPPLATSSSDTASAAAEPSSHNHPTKKQGGKKRLDNSVAAAAPNGGGEPVRRCLHCAAEKTPQWRTGPMGPKTLCNACGVRFKSGRLVPEYRPAASPTFVSTRHSNSHRKVLELRRQKEVHRHHHHQQNQQQQHFMGQNGAVFGVARADQYLIHHHMAGPPHDPYRQMI